MRHMRIVLLTMLLALPMLTEAQSLEALTSVDPFTLTLAPQYPAPGASVTVTALSGNIDLANATMQVSVGNASVYKGAVKSVEVPVGKVGELTTIRVTITANGASYSKTVSVRPQDLVLVSEPLSTAPPLYLGKAGTPLGGSVRIVAIASFRDGAGRSLDPAALSYAWTMDGARQAAMSGIGKNVVVVASPLQYRDRSVSVTVASGNGSFVSGAALSIVPVLPHLRIYENDPLLGVRFDRALGGAYEIRGAEAPLFAALYSFPILASAPAVTWYLNGRAAESGPSITLRPTGRGAGTASLSLVAAIGDVARATSALSLSFGSEEGSNFFGL